jgi:hypothetical protein
MITPRALASVHALQFCRELPPRWQFPIQALDLDR